MGPAECLEPLKYAEAHSQTVNTLINETWSLTPSLNFKTGCSWSQGHLKD